MRLTGYSLHSKGGISANFHAFSQASPGQSANWTKRESRTKRKLDQARNSFLVQIVFCPGQSAKEQSAIFIPPLHTHIPYPTKQPLLPLLPGTIRTWWMVCRDRKGTLPPPRKTQWILRSQGLRAKRPSSNFCVSPKRILALCPRRGAKKTKREFSRFVPGVFLHFVSDKAQNRPNANFRALSRAHFRSLSRTRRKKDQAQILTLFPERVFKFVPDKWWKIGALSRASFRALSKTKREFD